MKLSNVSSSACLKSIRKKENCILIVTPSLRGGSWTFLDQLMQEAKKNLDFVVAGLDGTKRKYRRIRIYTIPYFKYDTFGLTISMNGLFALLYELPLLILSFFTALIYRPKIIIGNGFVASLGSILIAKLVDGKVVVSHRGYIEYYVEDTLRKLVCVLSDAIEHVFVNSQGSKSDVSVLVNPKKVTVVEHVADPIFFTARDRAALRQSLNLSDKFVILYVGKIDREKHCDTLIQACERLRKNDDVLFLFVGDGELVATLKKIEKKWKNVKHLGYIYDRGKLRDLYKSADLVWSLAEETYIARPAVEALACGTPVLFVDVPAILLKARHGAKINHELIPKDIGWIVDKDDLEGILGLINKIKCENIIDENLRAKCIEYARKRHSKNNMKAAVEKLLSLIHS